MSLKKVFHTAIRVSSWSHAVAIGSIALLLSACTDYVDKYEGDFKDDYGDRETFIQNLNSANLDLASVCSSGDWFWCASQDGAYTTSNDGKIETYSSGDVRFTFTGTDDNAYKFSTNELGNDLLPYLRRNGGISVSVEGSGEWDAGLRINTGNYFDLLHEKNVVVAYENSCPGVKINLDVVTAKDYMERGSQVKEGTVLYRYSGELPTGGFQVMTVDPDQLTNEIGDSKWRTAEFSISATENKDRYTSEITIEFTESCSEFKDGKGLNLVGIGLQSTTRSNSDTVKSSSSSGEGGSGNNGGSTVKSSSSLAKSSSSSANTVWAVTCKGTPNAGTITWEPQFYFVSALEQATAKYSWTLNGALESETNTAIKPTVTYLADGEYFAQLSVTVNGQTKTTKCSALIESGASGFLWKGSDKLDLVQTDFGSGSKWYSGTDQEGGGSTTIQFPEINPYDECEGKCGMVWFGNTENPYATVGFNLDENGNTYDVSAWKGLCIAYYSPEKMYLKLDLQNISDYGSDLPTATLPSLSSMDEYRVENIEWTSFKQGGWGNASTISGEEAARILKGVAVTFAGSTGGSQFFNIYQIGSYGKCGNVQPKNVDMSQFRQASAWDYLNPNISYGEITDSRDGQVYKTVKIGNQTWMAQNLNYADSVAMPSLVGKTKCAEIESSEPNCKVVGRLYTYAAAIDSITLNADGKTCGNGSDCYLGEAYQGVCPEGYHLPTKQDWQELLNYSSDNGASLRAATSLWGTPEPIDTYGFSVLPFGSGSWGWDKSPMMGVTSESLEYYYGVTAASGGAFVLYGEPKEWAAAVRCVKTEAIPTSIKSTDLIWYGGNKLEDASAGTYLKQANLLSGYTWVSGAAKSGIQFPAPVATGDVISDSIIARCGGGICGKVGSLSEEAYIGFDVDASANLEEWGGVCLTYKASTDSIIMYLGTGGGADTAYSHSISWNLYHVTLPATDVVTTRCFSWLDDFNQYWEGSNEVQLDAYLPHVRDLSFRFTSATVGATFNIIAVGTYKDKVSAYNTYMQNKANRTSAWDYLNPAIEYGEFTDERDGQVYKTIDVGNYTWFAQNLNLEYNDGEGNSCPGSDPDSCAKYGRMYTWAAAMDTAGVYSTQALECGAGKVCWLIDPVQGVCPEGWHLPSNAEWRLLVEAAGGESTAAVALKSTKGWVWNSSNTSGTDDLGFSAIPNGPGEYGYFWSGTENSNISGYRLRLMGDATPSTHLGDGTKSTAMNAVRCVKEMNPKPRSGSFTYQGQTYNYVRIGTQTWMAENLNYDIGNNMCYENDPANCTAYGRMYKWATVVGKTEAECGYGNSCDLPSTGHVQGICPEGWHVPRRAEVETLVEAAGGDDFAGKALKATSTWSDYENNGKVYGNGTDATGFTGYSTGTCSGSSSEPYCNYDGMYTHMWTITENYSGEQAYYFGLLWMGNGVTLLNGDKRDYKNLRCVQDED